MTFQRVVWWIANVLLIVAAIVAVALGMWQFGAKTQLGPSAADRNDARRELIGVATADAIKILTYTSDTVEQDTAAALEVTTGEFTNYLDNFTREIVIPNAREKGISVTATVSQAGVVSIEAERGSVLLFVDRITTSTAKPGPSSLPSAVRVGLLKIHGVWLVDEFDVQ